jgi:glycopeptide antibiotics resistance protein
VRVLGAIIASLPIGRLNAAALAVRVGASMHVLWEIAEYLVMRLGSSCLQLTYEDTIGDLALSSFGSLVGALIAVTVLWGRSYVNLVLFGARGATNQSDDTRRNVYVPA